MGLGSGERGKGGCVLLYRSQDLRNWTYLHKLCEGKPNGRIAANPCDSGEMWECPDFLALNGHYCLFYSTEDKVTWTTGEYDDKAHRFTPTRRGVLDHGSYYAPKSFLAPDGRRILWGWIRETRQENDFSAVGWAGAMSLPRVLTVDKQGQLEINPAEEVKTLRGPVENILVTPATPHRSKLATLRHEMLVPIDISVKSVTVRLVNAATLAWELTIDVAENAVRCGNIEFSLPSLPLPSPSLRLFLDGSVIESFIGGREVITSRVYAVKPGETELEMSQQSNKSIEISHWTLNAISPNRMTT
jgi:beta-fructofuranosidase